MTNWQRCTLNCRHGRHVLPNFPAEYDLPVCPRCGGLGCEVDEAFFRKHVMLIRAARFAYCPFEQAEHYQFPPPACLRRRALRQMAKSVTALLERYGHELDAGSYAVKLRDDLLPTAIELTTGEMEIEAAELRAQAAPDDDDVAVSIRAALTLVAEGRLNEAQRAICYFADDPEAEFLDLLRAAAFFSEYRRDWRRAIPYLERAKELEPDAAEVHLQLLMGYTALHRHEEARLAALDTSRCPGLRDQPLLQRARRHLAEQSGVSPLRLVPPPPEET